MLFHADKEWVKVDEIYIGPKGKDFYDTRDFLIDPAAPSNLIVRICVPVQGKREGEREGWMGEREREREIKYPIFPPPRQAWRYLG